MDCSRAIMITMRRWKLCSTYSVSWASARWCSLEDKGFEELAEDVVSIIWKRSHPERNTIPLRYSARRARQDLSDGFHGDQRGAGRDGSWMRFRSMRVDVHEPDRDDSCGDPRANYICIPRSSRVPAVCPWEPTEKPCCCLSGGIDSPVAGYMVAKRGVIIDAVYFHAPPYTSERAKQKVVDLATIMVPDIQDRSICMW